jgi:acetyl esterase/lipase
MAPAHRTARNHYDDPDVRRAIARLKPYVSPALGLNPLLRPIIRRLAAQDWADRLGDIDFPYVLRDVEIAGVKTLEYGAGEISSGKVILYVHGGGFIGGSARANAATALPLCRLLGARGVGVDYTLAPEAVFPKALIEIETVYRALLASGVAARDIVLLGDSAGGNLAQSSVLRWRDKGLDPPGAVILLSPLLDALASSDTIRRLQPSDPLIRHRNGRSITEAFRVYAPGEDWGHPHISPLYGDHAGLPPTLVHVGSREVLLGEAARFTESARRAGSTVELRVFDGMFHLFHMYWRFDQTRSAFQDMRDFVLRTGRV